jgi:hypothetical protein
MVNKLFGMALLLVSVSQFASAGPTVTTPEIDSATAVSGLALLAGALLVIRARRYKG